MVEQYHNYKTVDNESVIKQSRDPTTILDEMAQSDVQDNTKFAVGALFLNYLHHGEVLPPHLIRNERT